MDDDRIGQYLYESASRLKRNKPFIRRWIKALRSGKYDQTNGYLHIVESANPEDAPVGYCCLGVACHISTRVKTVVKDRWVDEMGVVFYESGGEADSGMLPTPFRHWIGLSESECDLLAEKNDEGASFSDIADYLEEHILPTDPD